MEGKEARKTETAMGGLCEERHGRSWRGTQNKGVQVVEAVDRETSEKTLVKKKRKKTKETNRLMEPGQRDTCREAIEWKSVYQRQ